MLLSPPSKYWGYKWASIYLGVRNLNSSPCACRARSPPLSRPPIPDCLERIGSLHCPGSLRHSCFSCQTTLVLVIRSPRAKRSAYFHSTICSPASSLTAFLLPVLQASWLSFESSCVNKLCPGLVWLISHHSGFSFITALYQNDSWSLVFNSHDLHAFIAINSFTPPPIWCCTVHWACTTSQVLYQWAIASVLCVAPLYRPPTLFWWFLVFACLFVWEIVSCNLGWPWAYCVFEDFWFWSVLLLSPKYCSSRVVICKHFTN